MALDDDGGMGYGERRIQVYNEPKKYIIVDHESCDTMVNQTEAEVLAYMKARSSSSCDVFEQGRKVQIKVTLE